MKFHKAVLTTEKNLILGYFGNSVSPEGIIYVGEKEGNKRVALTLQMPWGRKENRSQWVCALIHREGVRFCLSEC